MDGVLPYTATPPPQGLATAGPSATGDSGEEGGFAGALNRSMAAPSAAPSAEGQAVTANAAPVPTTMAAAAPALPAGAPGSTLAAAGAVLLATVAAPAVALAPDAATPDAATPDAATPDAAAPDLETPDRQTPDLATMPPSVTAQRPKPGKSGPDAVAAQPAPNADPAAEPPESPLAALSTPLPVAVSPRPHPIAVPAEPDAPAEEEATAPAETSPLTLSLPAQAPAALAAAAPGGLSALSPRSEAPPIQADVIGAEQPDTPGEGDAVPGTPARPELPASEQHAREKQASVPAERAPPPNLTASLWQAEALAPLAGHDPGGVALRPGEIISAQPAAAANPPPPAARQVASVAVALAFAPNGTGGFSLSLEPAELGRVEIRVQREGDRHSVRVTAERPETLALLQRDRHELDRNLAEAGLQIDAGGIAFSLEGRGSDSGGSPGDRRQAGSRGQDDAARRAAVTEMEAPPQRLGRSLLDLNI